MFHQGKMWKCELCDYKTYYQHVLSSHMDNNHKTGPVEKVQCPDCEKMFVPVCLEAHRARVHGKIPESKLEYYKPTCCTVCGKQFQNHYDMAKHRSKYHDNPKFYECKICEITFKEKSNFIKHENSPPHKEKCKPTLCMFCGEQFENYYAMKKHRSLVHKPSNSSECVICNVTLHSAGNLKVHQKSAKHLRKLSLINGYRDKNWPCMPQRTQRQTNEQSKQLRETTCLKCKESTENFIVETVTSIHKELAAIDSRPNINMALLDSFCFQSLTDYVTQGIHRTRNFSMPLIWDKFICEKCNNRYKTKKSLAEHIENHKNWTKNSALGKLECKLCDYKTDAHKWQDFNTHYRKLHILGKHIACDECDQRFTNTSNLNAHKLSKHSNEKPFKCDQCSYKTKKKCHLITEQFRTFSELSTLNFENLKTVLNLSVNINSSILTKNHTLVHTVQENSQEELIY